MTKYNPQTIEATARKTEQRMVKLCKILKKQKPSDLDYSIRVINNKVFDKSTAKSVQIAAAHLVHESQNVILK